MVSWVATLWFCWVLYWRIHKQQNGTFAPKKPQHDELKGLKSLTVKSDKTVRLRVLETASPSLKEACAAQMKY